MLSLPETLGLAEAPLWVDRLQDELKGDGAADPVEIDAVKLAHFDSAVLALLLHFRREALQAKRGFVLRGAPPKLLALADLYGVREILGLAPQSS